ncbi:hypothetical protein KAR91_62540 [Candidatus Pacearchaeota archaeon]|nr:hypothetical protein [Candidatus Pacearchaeota archaeon]
MINPVNRAAVEQEMAMVCEVWPPYLYSYYIALIKRGFTRDEAMELIINFQTYRLIRIQNT